MVKDILPELLDKIQYNFNERLNKSKKVSSIKRKIEKGTATYIDAQTYSIEVGEILASVFKDYLSVDVLPEGKMYYNIAERLLNETLGNNHVLISEVTKSIQELLNSKAGLGLKSVDVPVYKNKIKSIVNRLSQTENFDEALWILGEPIVTFSQNVVDESIKANMNFQAKSGLRPKITRTVRGRNPCDWCESMAGTYIYPDIPSEVFTRHDRCKCSVTYDPVEGKKQDVWTKEFITQEEKELIEQRKNYGL